MLLRCLSGSVLVNRFAGLVLALLFAMTFVLVTLPARAQDTAEGIRIAIIDVQAIMREAKAAQAIDAAIGKQRKIFTEQVREESGRLQQEEEKLARQKSVLSPEAFKERRGQLKKQVNEFNQSVNARSQKLNRIQIQETRRLREAMNKSLFEVMKARGFNLALARATVVIFDEEMNITNEVLANLDKSLPSVEVDFSSLKN